MRIEITAHIYMHDSKQLDRIEEAISHVFQQGVKTMSQFGDFATKQNEFVDRIESAVGSMGTSVEGLKGDFKTLLDEITKIQNSPGTLSPEDQASLDTVQSRTQTAAEKVEALAAALKALDELNPPAPPADTGGAPQIPGV